MINGSVQPSVDLLSGYVAAPRNSPADGPARGAAESIRAGAHVTSWLGVCRSVLSGSGGKGSEATAAPRASGRGASGRRRTDRDTDDDGSGSDGDSGSESDGTAASAASGTPAVTAADVEQYGHCGIPVMWNDVRWQTRTLAVGVVRFLLLSWHAEARRHGLGSAGYIPPRPALAQIRDVLAVVYSALATGEDGEGAVPLQVRCGRE